MPTTILSITSILEYRQHQSWQYQPQADGLMTSWAAAGLPPGMSCNSSTGLISGAATTPGVFVVSLSGVDYGLAAVDAITFPIAIEPTVASPTGSGMELYIDPVTGVVTRDDGASDGELFVVKEGDDVLLVLRWRRNGTVVEIAPTAVRFTLKEFEPEAEVLAGDEFAASGSGSAAQVLLYVHVTRSAVEALMSSYEGDVETAFTAVAEIEWLEPNTSGVGPNPLRRTSQSFRVRIVRDLGEVAE